MTALLSISLVGNARDFSIDDLTKAAGEGNLRRVLDIVESGVNVNTKDSKGWFPISKAAASGQTEVVKILVRVGANRNARTSRGNTPLIFAASRGHKETVKYLLQLRVNRDIANVDGETASSIARKSDYRIISAIIDQN
jgi:ankyrin repeat protein